MRVRTDSWWLAARKRAVEKGASPDPRTTPPPNGGEWSKDFLDALNDPNFEAAQDGDVWVLRGEGRTQSVGEGHDDWPVIGYGLVCPRETCEDPVHLWTHASDCEARYGQERPCKHGGPSCWTWTGSPGDDTLTAHPSLWIKEPGCGWHGFLRNGKMQGV